jgi:hypothetical protein
VLYQGYVTRSHFPIRVGGDGTGQTWGRYRFLNNTIVLGGATTSAVFRLFDGIESVEMHNNVLYRQGGGAVTVLRDAEAVWKSGTVIGGSQNWVTAGSSAVPATWSGTRTGSNPGFIDAAGRNLRLVSSSSLIGAGTASPASPPACPFPSPLTPARVEPPLHVASLAATTRPLAGVIDIGAYEFASGTSTPPPPPPPSTTLTLLASADAYVESGDLGNTNFGSANPLLVKTGATAAYNRDVYLKFDVSSATTIGSARLRTYAALTSMGNGTISMAVHPVASSAWTELGITWNNRPPRSTVASSTAGVTSTAYGWYEMDVTSFVRTEKAAGRNLVTLALHGPAVTDSRIIVTSRESSTAPRLVVTP